MSGSSHGYSGWNTLGPQAPCRRFIVFCIPAYDPCGGLHDLRCSFDTLEEAQDHCAGQCGHGDDHQIVDRDTWEQMPERERGGFADYTLAR